MNIWYEFNMLFRHRLVLVIILASYIMHPNAYTSELVVGPDKSDSKSSGACQRRVPPEAAVLRSDVQFGFFS